MSPHPAPADVPAEATPERASRRALVTAAVGGAGAAAVLPAVAPDRAEAASYRPRRHRGTPLLGAADRHLVTRFSYGLTPGLTRAVRGAGGGRRWFERQLQAGQTDAATRALASWWPSLHYSPQKLWQRNIDEVEGGWEVMADYQRWLLLRRITTTRPVHELMTEFWMNHLNVPVHADAVFGYRFDYDRVVRARALGRFSELLKAAITHPAMGMYLSNAVSTKHHPNENLGRELLELHTVGRGNHYDEDDVKSSARILTGYRVDMWRTWEARYRPEDHWTGPVKVMGFEHRNADPDGRRVAEAYLDYLAHHPRTAQRIARKLAVKFVRDDPPQALVDTLARTYLRHDTAIVPVLRALVASRAFKASAGDKVRDPVEDLVATYRALGVRVTRPTRPVENPAAVAILWQSDSIGAVPHDWPRPDGAPIDNDSWSSPARLLASMDVHFTMSGRWWPNKGIAYREPVDWLPAPAVRFDVLVDHLCQQLLGRRSTSALLKACCQAARVGPATRIDREHGVVKWEFPRVLSTILDSPAHLTR
ncbi:DUF1800 domain-containing protein [Nocardioides marinquilinus]